MPTNFQKAKRRVKTASGWSDPISYATSSESVELTDGTDLQTKINSLGTAATKDVATTGDASTTQVVMGNDTRLTDSRPASDVSSWAKAPTKPTYTASEVGTYTSTEIDNKFSTLETNIDWKEAVATYSDIATTYPNPVDGWTVNVKDTDYTYRYNGTSWVAISANAIPEATTNINGLMTTTQVTKLDGISSGAEVNQNAFSKVKVGSTTVEADSKTDTLELVAGSNVSIIPDATNDKLTINATDTTYSNATTSASGLMSATDKSKLDGIEAQANKTVVDSAMSDSSTNPLQNKVITKELEGAKTTSGNPITVTDAAPVNAVNLSMDLEPIQAGSGTPSPDNIRPISGRSEVAIQRVGKNLCTTPFEQGGYSGTTGDAITSNNYIRTVKIPIKPNTNYVFSREINDGGEIYFWDNDENFMVADKMTITWAVKQTAFTSPNNAAYMAVIIYKNTNITPSYITQPQLELGNTATEYEPYASKTYTIQLGQTVYGCHYDVTRGKMVVDRGYAEFDGSSEGWGLSGGGGMRVYTYQLASRIKRPTTATELIGVISSQFEEKLSSQTYAGVPGISVDSNSGMVSVSNGTAMNVNDWKTYLASNPLQVVYELAEPYTIQLTPQQIRLLKGTNNISCNTGDLSIKYQPDNALGDLLAEAEIGYDKQIEYIKTSLIPSRERNDITNRLQMLPQAVAEQNLEKYGYKIGDYFTGPVANYTYHLADPNTFKGTLTPYCLTQNHLGIVVDTHTISQWYSGDASSVGYNGSTLHTYLKGTVMDNIKADMIYFFGGTTGLEHLLPHSKLLTTALVNWGWQANQYISALSEIQAIGSTVWSANGYQTGEAAKKLEIFNKYKWTEIFENRYPWLRNMQTASYACYLDDSGIANAHSVTFAGYVVGLINFY